MKRLFILSVAATTMLTSALAYAEGNELKDILVTGKIEGSLVVPDIETAKDNIRAIPGGAALVPAEEFKQNRAVTVKDMLEFTPGVLAQPKVAEEARLSIRGSGLSRTFHLRGLRMLQDGIPITLADGSSDFQDIDPLALRYVEVYKGANALRYGSANLGGAINYVTSTGYDASPLEARLEAGSFNTRRAQVGSGKVVGNSDYYFSLSNLQSDGFRDQSDQNNTRLFSNFGHKINDNLETRMYVTYTDINQELPGSITKAQLKSNPKQANAASKALNYQRDFELLRIANKTTWKNDWLEVNGGVYTTQKDLYHPIFQLVDVRNSDYGAFANTTVQHNIAGFANEFTLGGDASMGSADNKRFVNNAGAYGARTAESNDNSKNVNLYAENRFYATEALSLIAGTQFTYANRDYADEFLSDGDRTGEKDYYGTSPKLGVIYDVQPNVQVFSNLSWSYEPPTFSELTQNIPGVSGLAEIDAQKAVTFEVGTRGDMERFGWDISLYRSHLKDEMMMFSLGQGISGVVNADETVHQGIELGFDVTLLDGVFQGMGKGETLKLRNAYTFSDFRFDNNSQWGNNDIPGAPKHYIRSELRYNNPLGFYVAPNIEVVPEGYYVDMKSTLESDNYTLYGVRAGYDITKNVSFYVDARNLTDENYAATTDVITEPMTTAFGSNTAVFAPGEGRGIYVGLSYKW